MINAQGYNLLKAKNADLSLCFGEHSTYLLWDINKYFFKKQ